jgi:hypothetical protein
MTYRIEGREATIAVNALRVAAGNMMYGPGCCAHGKQKQ